MTTPKYINSTRLLRRVAAVMLLLSAVAIVAFAQSSNSSTNNSKSKKYVATKEIIFDQTTKTLRKPDAAETDAMVAQISALTSTSTEGLKVKTLANGTKQLNLQGRFSEVIIGRANADGTVETRCVSSLEEAAAFLGLEEAQ